MIILTEYEQTGFWPAVALAKDEHAAQKSHAEACAAIRAALPHATSDDIYRYLGSEFGERCAFELLGGRSVAAQLEYRMARFLRTWKEVKRRG